MFKRSLVFVCLAVLPVSGCATVSMLPGETEVQIPVSVEQAELRKAATTFNEVAETRGWISSSNGLFDLARILVDGQSADDNASSPSYIELIGVHDRPNADIMRTLEADAYDAGRILSMVTSQANIFLDLERSPNQRTARTDLMDFERTLVNAQKVRRTFIQAAASTGVMLAPSTEAAFEKFDKEIDAARIVANRLATEYSARTEELIS